MTSEINVKSTRFRQPSSASLEFATPETVTEMAGEICSIGTCPFFPTAQGEINLSLMHLTEVEDRSLTLFRCAYPELFFEPSVLKVAGFEAGRPLLECDSGNNNLGYFRLFERFFANNGEETNYHISNYSGGRGDYFGMSQLAVVHNFEQHAYAPNLPKIDVRNICATFGGQGAFRLAAAYLARMKSSSSIVVPDSTYCNVYAPFLAEGMQVLFAPSGPMRTLPTVDDVIRLLDSPGCGGMQYVRFNNPSGESFSESELEVIISELAERDQFLIYAETYEQLAFQEHDTNYMNVLAIAERRGFKNLVRIKTIAKDRGLAGFRAGYLIGPKDLALFGVQYNSLLAFNPPMTNTRLLVANAYLSVAYKDGFRDPEVEKYLGITRDETEELVDVFAQDTRLQTEALRTNVEYVIKKLIGTQSVKWTNDTSHVWHENEDFRIYHPQGGINMLVELKVFEGIDQIDFVRKAYLATGVIFHPSIFLNHRSGLHIRVTLSQSLDALSQVLDALLYVVQRRKELSFLPAGSFEVNSSTEVRS